MLSLVDQLFEICGCQPWSEAAGEGLMTPREKVVAVAEGMAWLEKATGQGHAYAKYMLRSIHNERKEPERAVEWHTKGAKAGLPIAMFSLAFMLDAGEGAAAPVYPAAVAWYKRAADAGDAGAAVNIILHWLRKGCASELLGLEVVLRRCHRSGLGGRARGERAKERPRLQRRQSGAEQHEHAAEAPRCCRACHAFYAALESAAPSQRARAEEETNTRGLSQQPSLRVFLVCRGRGQQTTGGMTTFPLSSRELSRR